MKLSVIDEVEKIVMVEINGWIYPRMICKSGAVYDPHLTATGNCEMLSWKQVVKDSLTT
jgi:hypothetical protein